MQILFDKQKTRIAASFLFSPAVGYSSRTGLGPSTIAAEGLNFCVRDGNRCDPFALTTGRVPQIANHGSWNMAEDRPLIEGRTCKASCSAIYIHRTMPDLN